MSIALERPSRLQHVEARSETAFQDWSDAVASLESDISAWARSQGWDVVEHQTEIEEDAFGRYELPALEIRTPKGRVRVEPQYRFVIGADGRVDILAWPDLTTMMLLRRGDEWAMKPEMGPRWPTPWSRDTFIELVRLLTENE